MQEVLDAALFLQSLGLAVFPTKENDQKRPATRNGFHAASLEPARAHRWWGGKSRKGLAVATGGPSGGIVVIDLDVHEGRSNGVKELSEWEKGHGKLPVTVMAKTGGGGLHLYYRGLDDIRCSTNDDMGVDIRATGGYVVAPPSRHESGDRYGWENDPILFKIAEADDNVLAFIKHAQRKQLADDAEGVQPESVTEGGRNSAMFRLACELRDAGLSETAVLAAVGTENEQRCSPPLPMRELETTVKSACSRDAGSHISRGKFDHVALGQALIDKYLFRFIDDVPAVWTGTRYAAGGPSGLWHATDRAMIELRKGVTTHQRREVRDYLLTVGERVSQSDKRLLAFENGVLDTDTEELRPMAPEDQIINIIPHSWNPEAKSAVLDAFLNAVSCGSAGTRANLEEAAGLCLYRSAGIRACALLVGSGANGKSVYIETLKNLAGPENCSFLDPRNMARNAFQVTALAGKTANFCDDMSVDALTKNELGVLKAAITGGELPAEVKGGHTFSLKPYAFNVFATNQMPRFLDRTEGVMSRLHIVGFKASFTPDMPSFDLDMAEKLRGEGAAQAFAVLAVKGLRRCLANKAMTQTPQSMAGREEARRENSPVYRWCMEEIGRESVLGRPVQDVYDEFLEWSRDEGLRSRPARRTFSAEVAGIFGFRTENNGWDPVMKKKFRRFEEGQCGK